MWMGGGVDGGSELGGNVRLLIGSSFILCTFCESDGTSRLDRFEIIGYRQNVEWLRESVAAQSLQYANVAPQRICFGSLHIHWVAMDFWTAWHFIYLQVRR